MATFTEYGGYEYSFVNNPPDRCMCKICQLPSRDAYMTGHCCRGLTICKTCLNRWQKNAGNRKCPVCRKEQGGFNKNYPIEREVNSLHIYCTNKEKGCEWQGELNDINNHLNNSKGCMFAVVKCSNKCGKMMQRRYLIIHVKTKCPRRKVNCQYCHDTGEYRFIEGWHKKECLKLPLPCPNKCEVESVFREDLEAHRKECPLEMIQCEYYGMGCEVRMARKDQEEHDNENMKEHLRMTNHELTDTQVQVAKLTSTKDQLAAELTDTKVQLVAALKQTANLTAILMNAHLGPSTVASRVNIRSVHLDSMAEIFKCGNQTCPVTIKMSQYSIKRRDETEWCSDPFCTHNKGYKMYCKVYSAGVGDGKGTHLSVYMILMKGPHDDELTWPLRGTFKVTLLNQISDSEHHSITVAYDEDAPDDIGIIIDSENEDDGWGHPEFISNKDLNKITPTHQFLKDDSLFFQVTKLY